MELDQELLKIIACPSCKANLEYNNKKENLKCRRCGIEYPIESGIPIFLEKE